MKTAHYFASKSKKFVEIKNEDGSLWFKKDVAGKSEARLIAKEASAKPWNF